MFVGLKVRSTIDFKHTNHKCNDKKTVSDLSETAFYVYFP